MGCFNGKMLNCRLWPYLMLLQPPAAVVHPGKMPVGVKPNMPVKFSGLTIDRNIGINVLGDARDRNVAIINGTASKNMILVKKINREIS